MALQAQGEHSNGANGAHPKLHGGVLGAAKQEIWLSIVPTDAIGGAIVLFVRGLCDCKHNDSANGARTDIIVTATHLLRPSSLG